MPTNLLLQHLDTLLPKITEIINDSLNSGSVPSIFKNASVKPLLKKPSLDNNMLKNYRPVSNLSFLSKLLERVVQKQLFAYLNANKLLPLSQSAYRPHHSTETALLKVMNDLMLAMDRDEVSVLTLLDLSAAFDTIDHGILTQRLFSLYGITDSALKWFQSYLGNRTQCVTIDGISSDSTPLSFGVPQGSVLGPILFILYTKPLESVIASHSVLSQSFADDTQMYASGPPNNVLASVNSIEKCASDVKVWMTQNKLKLNDEKTEVLLIKPKKMNVADASLSSLKIGTAQVTFTDKARDLGFTVSSDLSLQSHVSAICQSANYEIRKIAAVRPFLSVEATKKLVCAFVLSRLDLFNSLLCGCDKKFTDQLQLVQNNAARLIMRTSRRNHISPVLRDLHWLKIKERIDYKLCTLCYGFFVNDCPSYFSSLLTKYSCPRPNTRSSTDSRLLKSFSRDVNRVTHGERTFSFCAPLIWNSLPFDIRHKPSVESFKVALKTYLFRRSHT